MFMFCFYPIVTTIASEKTMSERFFRCRHPDARVSRHCAGTAMAVSAVSYYRGGTPETVAPLSKRMKAVLLKRGVLDYQVSRVQTGLNVGAWLVVVRYADWAAFAKAQEGFADDPEHRAVVTEISQIVQLISRELVVELDL